MPSVMISLPVELLAEFDREAARRGTSRSELLAGTMRRELDRRDPCALDELIRRSRTGLENVGGFESADLVRRERDS